MAENYVCPHEADFGEMKAKIKAMEKVLYGNGQKGLQNQLVELNTNLELRKPVDEDIRKNVSAMVRFMQECDTEKKVRNGIDHEKIEEYRTKRADTYKTITIIVAVAGLLVTVILKFL